MRWGRQLIKPAMRHLSNLLSLQMMYVEPMVGCPTTTHTLDPVYFNQIRYSGNPYCLEIQERTMVMVELYLFRNLAPRVMAPFQLVGSARWQYRRLSAALPACWGKGNWRKSSYHSRRVPQFSLSPRAVPTPFLHLFCASYVAPCRLSKLQACHTHPHPPTPVYS